MDEAVMSTVNLLSLAGCLKNITLQNKNDVVQDLINWYVLQRTRTLFERLQEGLSSLSVMDSMKAHPETFKPIFCQETEKLTA
ncbi:G2/M phase-specific E3 ubiquitin-protein ligase-like [Acipenser oxyrinchus oxyrinchus]|uniref:G2/M phase-specific E3 ubiquitin-protein ligase-like n=1 Tax=Acipenser oxyrinchus oxyrinchus TaxID=40147 RepID=A0AAD8LMS9_ACIOX|nr:G2/M phase-specific E3 ubiquitin-protein ligase-like [Acipenser oxyrinchus oxyrinchus]